MSDPAWAAGGPPSSHIGLGAAEIFLTLVREAPSELHKTHSIEHGPLSMAWLPLSLGQSIMTPPPPRDPQVRLAVPTQEKFVRVSLASH